MCSIYSIISLIKVILVMLLLYGIVIVIPFVCLRSHSLAIVKIPVMHFPNVIQINRFLLTVMLLLLL